MSKVQNHEVTWDIDGTRVYATLTGPDEGEGLPAVVFLAGSGPTDRNWNTPLLPGNNGSGRLLAMALAGEGFVTLRYDKRVSGVHAANNIPLILGKISLESHLEELTGAVDLLASREEIDPERIFVLTNSEGAIHALNHQINVKGKPFAGMVLTAPPGRSVSEVVEDQVRAFLAAEPDAEGMLARYRKSIESFLAGGDVSPDPSLPEAIRMLLEGLTAPANQPFARELWSVDITGWLAQVEQPALVVIGQKDLQVDWRRDGGRLEAAVGGRENVSFVYPEHADHVLKHEPKPREELDPADAANYNEQGRVLDEEAWGAIRDWLVKQSGLAVQDR